MARADRSESWFSTLRRDRGLFALVGVLALLLGLLQPLAAAKAAAYSGLAVICHGDGTPDQQRPQKAPDCPLCPTGHHCGMHLLPALPAQAVALYPGRAEGRLQPFPPRFQAPASTSEAPPSIRAPPLSA